MRKVIKRTLIVLAVFVAFIAGLYGAGRLYFAWFYPYRPSHCCDIGLMFALDRYARDHNGAFPAGEATPEASLSLLYAKYPPQPVIRYMGHVKAATVQGGGIS